MVQGVVVEIVKTVGKALLAGVGVEIARVAGQHLNKRLGPNAQAQAQDKKDAERLKAENEALRTEVSRLKAELAATEEA